MQGKTLQMDHLGICAQVINETNMCEKIDALIPAPKSTVEMGKRVSAMILNGLGFVNRALSLTPSFLRKRPVQKLLGEGYEADMFNDDSLGRCLDAIHSFGEDKFFSTIALDIASEKGLVGQVSRLDSTSFKVFGEYANEDQGEESGQLEIVQGFSKDHRPDMNQIMMSLVTNGASDFPIMMLPQSGNTSDKAEFHKIIEERTKELQSQFQIPEMTWYADSALYGKDWIKAQRNLSVKWVTRMPNTVKICKKAKQEVLQAEAKDWTPGKEGYRFFETEDEYCDLKQRLIVVDSDALAKTQRKSFDKKIQRLFESAESKAKNLSRQEFSCLEDAEKAVQIENKKMTYHQIEIVNHSTQKHFSGPGRPSKDDKPRLTFQLELKVLTVLEAVNCARKELGLFVLVTNNLDRDDFTASEALEGYKGLGANERFFRFLKDPHFFADSFYLKKTGRLSALLCIMTLALLVYHLCELKVRSTVKEHQITVFNLDKRKLKNPTAKLIFQHFSGLSVIKIFSATGELVQSFFEMLTEFQKQLLEALGPPYLAMYQTE